ncbi:MAG TPA: winged helix-turn-helix domain-containing protein [Blastocatellia bacterium]|nr:winged helix-turn-helix domain-containing protein [Blastocatellia bacterium]
MSKPTLTSRTIRFENFEFDFRSSELREDGGKVKVQGQPIQILAMLLEQPGELVTRDELKNKLWPGDTFVDFEHSLNAAVKRLRQALHDSAENPRFIETLARRGYRFIAEVAAVEGAHVNIREPATDNVLTADDREQPEVAEKTAVVHRPALPLAWKLSALALLVISTIVVVWMTRSRSVPPPAIRSLAVLPLENLSSDESQEYFADGMTDQLITDLGQISALRVISRTSVMQYKGVRKPLPQIARELNVDAVVEGTVLRSGDQVRITAQLIQARDDRHLWSHSYEGELRDVLALQNRVASAIAQQIQINLKPTEQVALKTEKAVNPEAHEAYLRGRYFWNKRTNDSLRKAIDYFNQAIAKDPTYAQAYTGLADSYALLGDWEYGGMAPKEAFPKAEAAATKALQLDDTLGEAHTSLAFCFDLYYWNWDSAEVEFKRAIELNPGYATAHHWYGWHLAVLGRKDEAIAEMREAAALDPLSLIISADLAEVLLVARLYPQSIQQSLSTIAMDPTFAVAHYQLGQAYVQNRMYSDAMTEFQRAIELSGTNTTFTSNLAYVYALAGRRGEALKILDYQKNRDHGFSNSAEIALIYVGLGNNDQAMTWLERAYEERFNPSILARPSFDPLRTDKRFQDLVHRIGLSREPTS